MIKTNFLCGRGTAELPDALRIVLRSDTDERWRVVNPVLLRGEPGIITHPVTGKTVAMVVGDGKTPYVGLDPLPAIDPNDGTPTGISNNVRVVGAQVEPMLRLVFDEPIDPR